MPDSPPTTDDPLTERLLLACVAGCTCEVKSPDIQWHDSMCHYRLFTEALAEIERLRALLESSRHSETCYRRQLDELLDARNG